MQCIGCGALLDDDTITCPQCGTSQARATMPESSPDPDVENQEMDSFRPADGSSKRPTREYPTEVSFVLPAILTAIFVLAPALGVAVVYGGPQSELPRLAAIVLGNWISPFILWFFAASLVCILMKRSRYFKEVRATEILRYQILPQLLADETSDTENLITRLDTEAMEFNSGLRSANLLRQHLASALSRSAAGEPPDPRRDAASFDDDRQSMESSFAMPDFMVWAIPVMGFIGTVWGISGAVAGFSTSFQEITDASNISGALQESIPIVTSQLSTAFDTTFLALLLSLPLMFLSTSLQKRESQYISNVAHHWRNWLAPRLQPISSSDGSVVRPEGIHGVGRQMTGTGQVSGETAIINEELKMLASQIGALQSAVTDFGEDVIAALYRAPGHNPDDPTSRLKENKQ